MRERKRSRMRSGVLLLLAVGLLLGASSGAAAQVGNMPRARRVRSMTGSWNAPLIPPLRGLALLDPLPEEEGFDPAAFDPQRESSDSEGSDSEGTARYEPVDRSLRRGRFEDAALILRGLAERGAEPERRHALLGAMELERALGHREAALADARVLLERHADDPATDPAVRWRATEVAAAAHRERGEATEAIALVRVFLSARNRVASELPLATRLRAQLRLIELERAANDERAAGRELRRAVADYRRAAPDPDARDALPAPARRAAAELLYLRAERLRAELEAAVAPEYPGDPCDERAVQRWAEGPFFAWLLRALDRHERAFEAYAEVVPLGDLRRAQAALIGAARTYLFMADSFESAPNPVGPACLPRELADAYADVVDPMWSPLRHRAEELLERAARIARHHRLFGAESQRAFALLSELNPVRFPALLELFDRVPREAGLVLPEPIRAPREGSR